MTTQARIHRGNEGEAGGIGEGGRGAGEGDDPMFQRLAQGFEGVPAEFRQLVEEEDTMVGEAHLA